MNNNNSENKNKIAWWKFLLPFTVQVLIVLAIPSQSLYTYAVGRTVTIQTIPVDPYDLLRGYSQTLRYDVLSSWNDLKKLPGGANLEETATFYVTLQAPESLDKQPPIPWTPVAVSNEKPDNLKDNQIAIAGMSQQYRRAVYGLETYYMPENKRNKINQEISNLQRKPNGKIPFVVDVKIDSRGNAVPDSLWIGDRKYQF
ncbi:MAG: GDYXXLXY domain-containing protein [Xenococcaceae cyanobacterium MO_188.B19]|nr:GDYXXLXY domain-containing protein [Xenococcaceae cyanobacterium MO_188.B19]